MITSKFLKSCFAIMSNKQHHHNNATTNTNLKTSATVPSKPIHLSISWFISSGRDPFGKTSWGLQTSFMANNYNKTGQQ